MAFQVTTAAKKILAMKARKKVIQGATSSGKTYTIIPIIADKCIYKKIKATVTAETLSSLKDGAIQIFKDFMQDEGRWVDEKWNATDHIYKFSNKSILQFKTFDSVGKAKAAGKRDLLFINEANHVAFDIADALIIRSKEIYLDFNADEEFWAHTEVLKSPNSEHLKLSYLDNEAIPKETLEDLMEKKRKADREERTGNKGYWFNWWQVYGLGLTGQRQELVYPIWEVLNEKPERFQNYIYAEDFGYQHPNVLLKIWYYEDELFVEEEIYSALLDPDKLVTKHQEREIDKTIPIIADSARPDLIQLLQNYGYYVLKAKKDVDEGITVVRQFNVYVHQDALNVQHENKKYKYKKVNGLVTDSVLKLNDDAMDALRYGAYWVKNYSTDNENETITVNI
jgi:phage terminase large subunit